MWNNVYQVSKFIVIMLASFVIGFMATGGAARDLPFIGHAFQSVPPHDA